MRNPSFFRDVISDTSHTWNNLTARAESNSVTRSLMSLSGPGALRGLAVFLMGAMYLGIFGNTFLRKLLSANNLGTSAGQAALQLSVFSKPLEDRNEPEQAAVTFRSN